MSKIILYHGSSQIIDKPEYGKGKIWNDYGQGFYCTQNIELAKEWACPENSDGFANIYEIKTENLNILNLQQPQYNLLHWLTLLIQNRKFDLETPVLRQGAFYLNEHFSIDITPYDVIIGYRADDSYFAFAKSFLGNTISYNQLQEAMKLGKLGEQFMVKSQKAFNLLKYQGYEIADGGKYSQLRNKRDTDARTQYQNLMNTDDISGLFIRDLILQEVKEDDARLR